MGIGALGYKTYICPQDQKESMAANQTTPTPVQITPHGYLMGNYTVTDPATFQQYLDKAGSMAGKYGGKAIIFDTNVEWLEGGAKQNMVVVEFPSVVEARAAYNSPEYSAVKGLRISSTDWNFVAIAQGVAPAK